MIKKLLRTGGIVGAGLLAGCVGPEIDQNKVYSLNPAGKLTTEYKPEPERDFIPLGETDDLESFVKKYGWKHVEYLEQIVRLTDKLEKNPDNIDVRFARGFSYQMTEQYEKAIRDYDLVLSRDRTLSDVYFNRGLAKKALARYVEAISDFKQCSVNRRDDAAISQIKLCEELADKNEKPKERDMPRHEKRDGCYITTACVQAANLDDDCFELRVLRDFRDGYIAKLAGGNSLIREYYHTAPGIVQRLSAQDNSREVFCRIFDKDIITAVRMIHKGDYDLALQHYVRMTDRLRCQNG